MVSTKPRQIWDKDGEHNGKDGEQAMKSKVSQSLLLHLSTS